MAKDSYFYIREKCPACNSQAFKHLYKNKYDSSEISAYLNAFYSLNDEDFNYLNNASYDLCECEECGLIFQKEIPDDDLMCIIYEKWIDSKAVFLRSQKRDSLDLYTYYAQEIAAVIAYLEKVPAELKFFDYGMGWGKWASMAKGFGCDSYGTELSEDRIKYATSNGIKVIEWNDIANHKFDFINSAQVFEHISSPLDTLIYLKDSLKDDGILKLSVPTANDISRRLKLMDWEAPKGTKNSLNSVAPLEHINYFRRESLIKMADLAGMQEVVIPLSTQYRFSSNWSGVKRVAKNILLPIYRNILKNQNYIFLEKKREIS